MTKFYTVAKCKNSITSNNSVIFGSKTTNKRGQILEKLVEEKEFVVLNTGTGTHINHSGSESSIDITMVQKNLGTNSNWEVIRNPLGSDHYPTLTTLNEHPCYEAGNTPNWSYKKADWATFKQQSRCQLSEDQIEATQAENISEIYTRFVNTLVQVAEENIPKITTKTGSKKVPYWNTTCQKAVASLTGTESATQKSEKPKIALNRSSSRSIVQIRK